MTAQDKDTIKSYFQPGYATTRQQFINLIDSYVDSLNSNVDLLDGYHETAFARLLRDQNIFKPTTDSIGSFQIQDTDANPIFVADTLNNRIGIGMNPSSLLSVNGDISLEVGYGVKGGSVGAGYAYLMRMNSATSISFYVPGGGDFMFRESVLGECLFYLNETGKISLGRNKYSPDAMLQIDTNNATTKGLIIKGSPAQSSNLFEINNSNGNNLAIVSGQGNWGIGVDPQNTRKFLVNSWFTTDLGFNLGSGHFITRTDVAQTGTLQSLVTGVEAYHQTGSLGTVQSISSYVDKWGAGYITFADGFSSSINNYNSSGTIDTAILFHARNGVNLGTTYNQIGLCVDDLNTASNNFAILTNAGKIVFNEGGDSNSDLRVEGDTQTHLLFTDASADVVGISNSAPLATLDVYGMIRSIYYNTPASGAGLENFYNPGTNAGYLYAYDRTSPYAFKILNIGASSISLRLADSSTGSAFSNVANLSRSEFVINEDGKSDIDFRVESDFYDALFVDASENSIDVMHNASGKIGFYAAVPTTQPTHIINADGTLADLTTKFNTLLSKLETLGLLASA